MGQNDKNIINDNFSLDIGALSYISFEKREKLHIYYLDSRHYNNKFSRNNVFIIFRNFYFAKIVNLRYKSRLLINYV